MWFTIAILTFAFYILFKFKTNEGFSFARTFPFETNKTSNAIKASLVLTFIFSICSVIFFFTVYSSTFDNNYILLASISSFLICAFFIVLNLVNLVNLKAHFLFFSLYAALVTTQSIILGFHSIFAYKIDGVNILYIIFAVVLFVKALIELLLISPLFKFSFLNQVDIESGKTKKPDFIRLAFYEWLYLFLFILNAFILLIEKMI
ncbi:MAG: hypothetical protein MJZ37_03410 [Bacilli bacterium]|nr:hypothetical protein [Bacilli bacterium]